MALRRLTDYLRSRQMKTEIKVLISFKEACRQVQFFTYLNSTETFMQIFAIRIRIVHATLLVSATSLVGKILSWKKGDIVWILKNMIAPYIIQAYQNVLRRSRQCHEIFCFKFFHESSSPKPLKTTLGSFRIFQKFRRYLQVKVHHQYLTTYQWQICHQYQWHWRQILPPVLLVFLILVAICHRYSWYLWQIMGTLSDYWQLKVNL